MRAIKLFACLFAYLLNRMRSIYCTWWSEADAGTRTIVINGKTNAGNNKRMFEFFLSLSIKDRNTNSCAADVGKNELLNGWAAFASRR